MTLRRNHRGCKSWENLHNRQNVRNVRRNNELYDCSHPSYYRKDRIHRVRTRSKKLNIPKLVYKFLGNVASLENKDFNGKKQKRSSLKRSGNKKYKKRKRHHPDAVHIATKGINESKTSVSTSKTMETNSTICTVPSIKTNEKFSMQAIKDYIKAGIVEGKRRAKKYMCKALSFGVDTGYLIPTDFDDQVLRVSSALISLKAQNDSLKNKDRSIRRKLRKGEATCTSEERRVLRRRGASLPQKRPRSPSSLPSRSSSAKRTKGSKTKKPKYEKRTRRHKKRKLKKVKLKCELEQPRGRINLAKMNGEKSCSGVKSASHDRGKKENLRDETLTSSRSEKDNSKSIKKKNLSEPSIEENRSSEEIEGIKEK